ncbi:MAG: tRNA pseudouridine(55) synthase TruB [Chloroflexota bacterium]
MPDTLFGFLNIDKPLGLTSHDVVARVRRVARQTVGKTKVGHAGTLDPLATGVLIVCLGHATRLSEYAMVSTKQYRAEITLGIETDTYDAEGEIIAQADASHVTQDAIIDAYQPYLGAFDQMPPIYSAIKKDGKKLYEIARSDQDIDLQELGIEARPVTIHAIELLAYDAPKITLDVTCSAGTYIRSLAHDIGTQLGIGAHLSGLVRTRSGNFHVDKATNLDDLLENTAWDKHLIDPADALSDWQTIALTDDQASDIQLGRFITKDDILQDDYVMAMMPDGHLLAVLENRDNHWKPYKVFLPQS